MKHKPLSFLDNLMVVKANNWMELEKVEIKRVTAIRQHPDFKVHDTKFPDLALLSLDGKLENFNNKDEVELAWFNPQDQSGELLY